MVLHDTSLYFTGTSRYFTGTSSGLHRTSPYFTCTSLILQSYFMLLHRYFSRTSCYFTGTSVVLQPYFTRTSKGVWSKWSRAFFPLATMHQQIYCLSDKWLMVVFLNMIDIAAINVMTIWLSQNPNWGGNCTHIRRLFLLGRRESLTTAHNDRRSQQSLRIRFEIAHASVSNSKR